MFKVNEIKELIRAVDKSGIGELEIRGENKEKLTIKKEVSAAATVSTGEPKETAPAPQPSAPLPAASAEPKEEAPAPVSKENDTAADETLHKITSPMVGTFYRSPSPEADPYVKEGDKVSEETIVCIVEAMKLMNELEAETSGEIVEILVENGELVEYGQPLFLVK
ncbi:acetyl-CoA carboxylase biotin carboxyl carrier protein [Bacillus piscicola]|uniref:acetyl-CoA carboxylase biotin carboxyl carrier protein n=1 Tax=Bacillus piscicola TaxID=1632684 RepID=UPI001F09FAE3|nr:acetyl-CoA carboxylase biotin carboxyl carrier protein [Bacillus piscicola]